MNHSESLRELANTCDWRGLFATARKIREIADEIEPKPLLSQNPTEAEIARSFREVGERRAQTIRDYETLWQALTTIQLAKGKQYHDEPASDCEVAVASPTVG